MIGPQVPFSQELHAQKYRGEGESFREAMNRVAAALKDDDQHYVKFRDALMGMRFLPAGRIQSAIGSTRKTTPYNCYVSGTIEDSFVEGEGSIMERATQAAATMRMGGGIGYDFSTLRPRGDTIRKLQSSSSGPISFMHIFDTVCKSVASSGHRRGAQMGIMRVDHPDIEEFIRAKQPPKEVQPLWDAVAGMPEGEEKQKLVASLQDTLRLTGFNVSVAITDEFMEAVDQGTSFPLRFGGRVYREVDAQDLWESIMRGTWDWAEPGVIFIDAINRMNNLWYCEQIAATNPCVPADTPILTNEGWLPIGKLVGERKQVWNGEAWSEVEVRLTGKDQPLVTVSLSDGSSLTCTPAHKFVLADGTRVDATELMPGEELLTGSWPVVGPSTKALKHAYAQGFYSGDGWLASNNRPYISFKREDKRALEERLNPVNAYDTQDGYRFLYMKGCVDTTDKSFVPDASYNIQTRLDWFAGLCDADGTVTKNYNDAGEVTSTPISVWSVDHEFIAEVALMLKTLGVRPTTKRHEASHGFPNGQPISEVLLAASEVQKLQHVGFITHRVDLSGNHPNRSAIRKLRVVSVEDAGRREDVFCFTEPERHMGCFNGVLTGQCGEQPLPPFGACLLGSFNLVQYIRPGSGFDWSQFRLDIPAVVRAMDNVVDRALYPLPQQAEEARSKRRMGLGITGLANAAEAMGYMYGSPEFLSFEADVLDTLRDESYMASAMIAKDKGSFPLYDKAKYLQGRFVRTLREDVRAAIARHGIRNSHLTSIAPTGTISLCADNVSSGIEPVFAYAFDRTVVEADGPRIETVRDYGHRVFGVNGKTCDQVTVEEHVAVLTTAAKRVDSAVSKTCNVPSDITWDGFGAVYTAAWAGGAKGCTTFRLGGKRSGILKAKEPEKPAAACYVDPATGRHECE